MPGALKEVPREARASPLLPGWLLLVRGAGLSQGRPVSSSTALREACLFLGLGFLPTHRGSESLGAGASTRIVSGETTLQVTAQRAQSR